MISALIVDDVQTELDVILYLIKKYELPLLADIASNGEEALAYLEHHTVDLLITDIKMPFMDGLELSKRAMARNPQIKIMISSGYSDFSYAKTAISIGVEEYLLKPIQPEEFVSTVKKVCEQIMKTRHTQKQVNELLSSLQTIYKLPSGMDAADVPAPQAL